MKKSTVYWTKSAQKDLEDIIDYIRQDSIQSARNVFTTIKESAQSLETFSERGRIVPELQSIGVLSYRELICIRWRLVYRINKEEVYVMMLIDSRQSAEDILFKRLYRKN